MIPEALNWIGSHWGRQHDAIVCEQCAWEDPTDTYEGNDCPSCGAHDSLVVAVDNGLRLELHYLLWKSNQRWWPQRYYELSEAGNSQFIMWRGKQWRVRPWEGL